MIPNFSFDSADPFEWLLGPLPKPKKELPPQVIFVSQQRVSFDETVQVEEFERSDQAKDRLWYSDAELESFSEGDHSDDSDSTTSTISLDHTRRVLGHYESRKETGIPAVELCIVSKHSSRRAKAIARERALQVAHEVDPWGSKLNFQDMMFGWNSRLANFYLNSFLDMFPESDHFCGRMPQNE